MPWGASSLANATVMALKAVLELSHEAFDLGEDLFHRIEVLGRERVCDLGSERLLQDR
jgi:hypothetical protein